jgi:PTS system ascorbate-specific IIA component
MSVGIVIVTHGGTGTSLIEEAVFVLGQALDDVLAIAVNRSHDPRDALMQIRLSIESVDTGDGVIVLTDLMGASPSNMVSDVLEDYHAVMVTGVNLSMLIRVCNYREQSLERVVRKAVEGGKRAVKIFQK